MKTSNLKNLIEKHRYRKINKFRRINKKKIFIQSTIKKYYTPKQLFQK